MSVQAIDVGHKCVYYTNDGKDVLAYILSLVDDVFCRIQWWDFNHLGLRQVVIKRDSPNIVLRRPYGNDRA